MKRSAGAFSLLELMTVILVIAILGGLLVIGFFGLRARAQRARCSNNLRNLYVATELYLQENGSWPQIPRSDSDSGAEEYANAWIAALSPFSVPRQTWICPTIQNSLQNPDYSQPENARIDYIAMPFDDKPGTPHRWPRQPWFVETGDVHGHGNLIIFTDGSINDLRSVTGAQPR